MPPGQGVLAETCRAVGGLGIRLRHYLSASSYVMPKQYQTICNDSKVQALNISGRNQGKYVERPNLRD
jgi:hypothetical protein